ncbi:hypothetical protein Tco_0864291 [Tanacetum coccineum]
MVDDSHILGIGSRRTDGLRRWSPYSILATAFVRVSSIQLLLATLLRQLLLLVWNFPRQELLVQDANTVKAMKNIEKDDDRQILPKRRDQEARD